LADANLTLLPLGPSEGFVLSRIDGRTSVDEIADATSLDRERVWRVVQVLLEFGAAELVDPPGRERDKAEKRQVTPTGGVVRTRPAPPGTSRVLYDPQELEELVELDLDRRRTILDTYYRLDELNFYALLGVGVDADKPAIRNAYFALSKVFHPDTLFGKELGSYKSKMEAVFRRLTEAYDILAKKRTRDEYDHYLNLRDRTMAAQRSVAEVAKEAERIEREAARAVESALVEPKTLRPSSRPPDVERPRAERPAAKESQPEAPKAPSVRPPPPPVQPDRPMSEAGKANARQLMARKLAAATGRPLSNRPPPKAQEPQDWAPMERDTLLRGLAGSLKQAALFTGGVDRASIHVEHAREAEAAGNLVSALNSLRLAVAVSQERVEVVAEYERVRKLYAAAMADNYEKQARYETRHGRWADAALSWTRVCDGRPTDGNAHLQASVAILEAKGDLAQARIFAQRALELMPGTYFAHRALGRVYHAIGMKLNAKRELSAALSLQPDDDEIKALLKELS
jgi:curved DNA-binding protein CbpA